MGQEGQNPGILKKNSTVQAATVAPDASVGPDTPSVISTRKHVSFSAEKPTAQDAMHERVEPVDRIFDNLKVLIDSKPWERQKGELDQKNADQATLYAARFAGLQHLGAGKFTIDPQGSISKLNSEELADLQSKCQNHKAGLDRALWKDMTTLIQKEIAWRHVAEQVGGESFRIDPQGLISRLTAEELQTLKIECQAHQGKPDEEPWRDVNTLVQAEIAQREVIERQALKKQQQYNEGPATVLPRTSAHDGRSRSSLVPMDPSCFKPEQADVSRPAITAAKDISSIRASQSSLGSIPEEEEDDDKTPPSPTAGRPRK